MLREKNVRSVMCMLAALIAIAVCTAPVGATVITPLNGSFEAPAFDAGTSSLKSLPTNWTAGPNHGATDDMDQLYHPSVEGKYAAAVDGITIAGLEAQDMTSIDPSLMLVGGFQQDIGTMELGKQYTFDATLYSHAVDDFGSFYRISFYNVTDSLELAAITEADFDPSALGKGKTIAATFSYSTTAADEGDTLRLIMEPSHTTGTATAWGWANRTGIDAVSVTTTPEPSTVMLLVTGLIGLLAYAWRKRK